ncbi:hypothetical protein ABEV74_11005 [Paenibacillus cisolokensis]|uniref:hypothetical protein n=1 Tax=Paenibacillus cisolokensis TaxID=1658519 RepID=UPI003D2D8B7B
MGFKDQVARDIQNVFLDSEFGEPVLFGSIGMDSIELLAVVDRDMNELTAYETAEGTYASKLTLYMRQADLGYVPVENQLVYFALAGEDTYPYIVRRVAAEMGILTVEIEANRS